MEPNKVIVTLEDLIELKGNLTNLSNALHEIYQMMKTEMDSLGDTWRDNKYMEFVEGYTPQINKCEEISVRYNEWCTREIEPLIERTTSIKDYDLTIH